MVFTCVRMLRFVVFIFALFFSFAAKPQENPVYSQFFLNPFVLNPAYAGHEGQPVLFFSHRQQWAGIEGAPATSMFSFNMPLKSRLSVGANIMNDARGLISTSAADFTLAYVLPTFEGQFLRFGLSGGIGMNRLRLEDADNPNDPALVGVAGNNFFSAVKFGLNYAIRDLNVGVAFPGLLDNDPFSVDDFSRPEFQPLEKFTLMANYRLTLSPNGLALEPHIVYRDYGTSFDQLELLAVLDIRDKVWLGGSYKTDYGFSAFAGLNFMDKFSLGYAYEIASSQVNSFSDGTHEFVFGIRIGKKKEQDYRREKDKEEIKEEIKEEQPDLRKEPGEVEEPIKIQEPEKDPEMAPEKDPVETPETGENISTEEAPDPEADETGDTAPEEKSADDGERYETVQPGDHPYELDRGHYVIVGAFRVQENARKHIQQLIYKGFNSRYGFSSAKGLYYVYVTRTFEMNEAKRVRNNVRKINIYQFEDAWILTVE